KAEDGSLVLHLVSRHLRKQGNELIPARTVLGETRSIGWGAYPQENWIVLSRADCRKLLPKDAAAVGNSWEQEREDCARIRTYFYPSTENNDTSKNRMEQQSLKATILSVRDGVARARLEGRLRMKHPFYHKNDDKFVEATLTGFIDFEPGKKQIRKLRLVTE